MTYYYLQASREDPRGVWVEIERSACLSDHWREDDIAALESLLSDPLVSDVSMTKAERTLMVHRTSEGRKAGKGKGE